MPVRRGLCGVALFLLPCLCRSQIPPRTEGGVPTFGTTVVIPSGLWGEIYYISEATQWLPKFEKLTPVGAIYTTSLNVSPRDFAEGFPGVTRRFEWFAIDYKGRFWIEKPGKYRFALTSDDGSKLYIDERLVIDNDGQHAPETAKGSVELSGGRHDIRVSYFQGPRFAVALVLEVSRPGERWRIFSTDEFKPPPNPEDWKFDDAARLRAAEATRTNLRDAAEDSPALAILNAVPLRHDFDLRLAAVRLRFDGGSWQSVLVIQAPGTEFPAVSDPARKARHLRLSVLARLKDARGVVVDRFRADAPYEIQRAGRPADPPGPVTYTHPAWIAPGHYTLEAAMVDQDGKRASAAAIELDSPEPRSGIGLSNVILVERLESGSVPADSPGPFVYQGHRVVPLLAPTLRPEAKPSVYFVAYPDATIAEKPRVQVELLVNGERLASSTADLPPADASGANPVLVEAALRAGNCDLRVTATQGANSVTESVRYTVAGQ